MFGRRQVRTQNAMMREEFAEGVDHLRLAAAHAAGSAAGMIAPRLDMVRERMIEPTVDKSMDLARDGARRAGTMARQATGKKIEVKSTRRWPRMVTGLMIAGAALGAVSALLSRRRQRRWDEYGSTADAIAQEARSVADTARTAASSVTEKAKDSTSEVLGQMKGGSEASPGTSEAYRSGSTTGSGSRNSHP